MLCAYRAGSLNTSLLKAGCQALLVGGTARGGGFLSGYDVPLSRPSPAPCSVDAFSSRWLLHCLVVTAASSSTHFSWFQNGGPPGKHFPMNSFPQHARGKISRKIHRRVHTATSLTFSEPWPGPQQGLHLSPGELWGEALSQSWGGESAVYCHSFNLYCYFLLASPSLLQSSGVVIFKFKLLCGFCFLIDLYFFHV